MQNGWYCELTLLCGAQSFGAFLSVSSVQVTPLCISWAYTKYLKTKLDRIWEHLYKVKCPPNLVPVSDNEQ